MKANDLVRFDRMIVEALLADGVDEDNWRDWMGLVLFVEDTVYCQVVWSDGVIRQEFIDNLEVISEVL